ncbi:hypothetical protein [Burkholderia sp. MSMB1078WGS]|uniref:hypothetical protein n=1 Tax=Burkholderia sp. MSMB1078WGS TaxID=1637900 RepID=UPI0012E3C483|nr:hypothetical protein [Burkholderia sp. MSMB1078WGS]
MAKAIAVLRIGYRPRDDVIQMEVICREIDLLVPVKIPPVFLAGKDSKEENPQ